MDKTGIAVWDRVEISQKKCVAWRFPARSIWVERMENEWHVLSLAREGLRGTVPPGTRQPLPEAHLGAVAPLPAQAARAGAARSRPARQARRRAARQGAHPPARAGSAVLPGDSRSGSAFPRRSRGSRIFEEPLVVLTQDVVRGPGHRGAVLGAGHAAAPRHRIRGRHPRTTPCAR